MGADQVNTMNTNAFPAALLGAGLLISAASAHAQVAPPEDEIIVTGRRPTIYAPESATTGTRIVTPILETPASIQVIDAELLLERAALSPRDLALTVAGVQPVIGYGNTPSQWYVIRGFSNAGVNYRDGYRSAEVFTPRDFVNIERVEFVKGPQSVLYGQGQPAGAVNTVSKTPIAEDFASGQLRFGAFDLLRATLDANANLGPVSLRFNGLGQTAGSYVQFEDSRTWALAPSIAWNVSPRLSLLYGGEFQDTEIDGFSNGLPLAEGVFDLPASATVSSPDALLENQTFTHRLEARAVLAKNWRGFLGYFRSNSDRSYRGISPTFNQFDGTPLADYPIVYNAGPVDDQRNETIRLEFNGDLTSGPLRHNLLIGYEHFKSDFTFGFFDQFGCDDLGNCFVGLTRTFGTGLPFPPPGGFTGGDNPDSVGVRTNAVYLSDQVEWGRFRLLAGVRHDRAASATSSATTRDSATTGRAGLLYLISPRASVYYSFGQSFIPNAGEQRNGNPLDPERGRQHEVGAKWRLNKNLEATAALFQVTRANIPFATGIPGQFITIGEQQSRGVELTLAGQLSKRLGGSFNYAYTPQAETTRDGEPGRVGARLYGVARHNFNSWLRYNVPTGLPGEVHVAAGVAAIGARAADNAGSGFNIPGYTRLDLALSYEIKSVEFSINANNVNDAAIFDTVDGFFVQRQAPRAITGTVRFSY